MQSEFELYGLDNYKLAHDWLIVVTIIIIIIMLKFSSMNQAYICTPYNMVIVAAIYYTFIEGLLKLEGVICTYLF